MKANPTHNEEPHIKVSTESRRHAANVGSDCYGVNRICATQLLDHIFGPLSPWGGGVAQLPGHGGSYNAPVSQPGKDRIIQPLDPPGEMQDESYPPHCTVRDPPRTLWITSFVAYLARGCNITPKGGSYIALFSWSADPSIIRPLCVVIRRPIRG